MNKSFLSFNQTFLPNDPTKLNITNYERGRAQPHCLHILLCLCQLLLWTQTCPNWPVQTSLNTHLCQLFCRVAPLVPVFLAAKDYSSLESTACLQREKTCQALCNGSLLLVYLHRPRCCTLSLMMTQSLSWQCRIIGETVGYLPQIAEHYQQNTVVLCLKLYYFTVIIT